MKEFDIDIVKVIGDFLELGHVENIVAMFKQDTSLYDHTGSLLRDERFTVRLGTAVLFEELALIRLDEISLAIADKLKLELFANADSIIKRAKPAVTIQGDGDADRAEQI